MRYLIEVTESNVLFNIGKLKYFSRYCKYIYMIMIKKLILLKQAWKMIMMMLHKNILDISSYI